GPMIVHCCHCRDCQRQTGGAFAVNALIETDRLEGAGEIVVCEKPTDSGRPHDIHRCAKSATALGADQGRRPRLRLGRATTLDEPDALSPDVHIFTRSKLPWVGLPPDVPAYEIFYASMAEVWSPQALARREAASKR